MMPTAPALDPMLVFDRDILRARRAAAATTWQRHDFLKREIADRLVDRLSDIRRQFAVALDLGCHGGEIAKLLRADRDRQARVGFLVQSDLAGGFAQLAAAHGPAIAADEEALPFASGAFNLVLSAMTLHWVNDLPGTLAQVHRILAPDGLFLGALLGGESLWQLRDALGRAESEVEGGLSARVSPFVTLHDAAGLLQRAGFALPVADSERIEVSYPHALALMQELSGMGESNAIRGRRHSFSRRQTLLRAAEIYGRDHATADGRVNAVFEVIYMHGWTPHQSQQQPMRPGAAILRLADALGSQEVSAGEKAGKPR